MQATQIDEGSGRISPEEYRLGLRWHLGLPVLPQDRDGATCPACGASVDVFGDHLLCCRRNNYYGRHFAVQEAFISMAQAGDMAFIREAPLSKANSNGVELAWQGPALRPADLLLRAWKGGRDVAIDFTVVHPLQESQKPWTQDKARTFLKTTEGKKVAKYSAACALEGWLFHPAAFDTWGGVGPQAKELLWKILPRAVGGVPPELRASRMADHRQHLSLALMRQVWKLVSANYRV